MTEKDWQWPQRVPQSKPPKKIIQPKTASSAVDYSTTGHRQLKRLKKNKRNRVIMILLSVVIGLTIGLVGSDTVRVPGEPSPYLIDSN
jgi:hypothetical protein